MVKHATHVRTKPPLIEKVFIVEGDVWVRFFVVISRMQGSCLLLCFVRGMEVSFPA